MIYASPVIMICSIITLYGFTRWKLGVIGAADKQRDEEQDRHTGAETWKNYSRSQSCGTIPAHKTHRV